MAATTKCHKTVIFVACFGNYKSKKQTFSLLSYKTGEKQQILTAVKFTFGISALKKTQM